MKLYAFELGRKKELCLEELITVLDKGNLVEKNLDTAIFKLDDFNPQNLQDSLGGTIKIIEIISEPKKNDLKRVIEDFLISHFQDGSGKVQFSISTLSYKRQQEINIKELLNFSKKILKSLGLNSRFVNKNFRTPRASTLFKAKVLQKGVDLNIIKGKTCIYFGKTVSIQNIDAYSKRDYDKPKRDMKVGMTPPKLCQIMINLAGKNTKTVYDPFCGTGSYLMEGILMNKTMIGSDINERMIEFSEENCKWLKEEFSTKGEFKIFKKDARLITKRDLPEKIDAIVTEGYLGPKQTEVPSKKDQEKIFRELSNLHLNWLTNISKITDAPIVMCIMAFQDRDRITRLPNLEFLVKTAGYKIEKKFLYNRQNQIVVREIIKLQKIT